MSYIDTRTGEIYGHLLWLDDHMAQLASAGGEAAISRAQWDETEILTFEDDGAKRRGRASRSRAPFGVDRYQAFGPFDVPPAVDARRAALESYAAGNGGVIHVARPPGARPWGLFGLGRRGSSGPSA